MANNKKFVVKNGLTTSNIEFKDDINNGTNTITMSMLSTDVLSFSGDSGQLFSISDSLTGTIFSVNDISGIPSVEVDDDGTIRLAEFAGNILVGSNTDNGSDKLQVTGNTSVNGTIKATDFTIGTSGKLTSNNYVQTQLGTKLNSSSYTASDVLTKIKTVDGAGSGLDADTLDGLNSTSLTSNNYIQDRLDTKATNTYVNSTFTSNNYVDGRFTSNNFVKAVFTSNNYVDNQLNTRIGIRATNTYVQSTFTSNSYVDGRFASNNYIDGKFASNNYLTDTFTSNNYVDGRFTSNNFAKATFTSNSFAVATFSSNAYMRDHVSTEVAAIVNSAPATLDTLNELAAALGDDPNFATTVTNQIGIRATNTYVNSTFTSNNYVDGRFTSNNFVKATFTSNNYVDNQLSTRIGIRATNTYVNSTFASNNYLQGLGYTTNVGDVTNTYLTATFTSNNYVDGRFASNNYVKGVFTSNNYVDAQLGTKLDSSSYTASDVLTKIKTVDGSGSGLDADLLDGRDSTAYLILGTTGTVTAPQYFRSASGNPLGSLSNPPLQAFATSGNSAFMSFHRSGEYAVNFGLDTDNVLRIGGWSASADRWELDVPTGNMTIAGDLTVSGGQVTMPAVAERDKYRVWNSSIYAIGMDNNFTFGGLATEYAMTFQMNDQATRGFWWGDNAHTDAQGAMALTTEGKLTVAHSARIGHGETDTTTPGATHALDVNGSITDDIGDVRSPQHFDITTAATITEEGVYYCTNAPTLTFGGGIEGGTIMTFYNNNASSMTINRGSFLNTIRLADNTTTNKSSVTLGAYSVATATCFITNNFILISGSDVT